MGIEENKRLLKRYFKEVINGRDYSKIDEFMHDDFNGSRGNGINGKEAHKRYFEYFFSAFPDAYLTTYYMVAEGERVVALQNWSGTFSGLGNINHFAKGRTINTRLSPHYEFKNGKLIKGTIISDSLNTYQQLGFLPSADEILKTTAMLRDPNTL